MDEHLALTETCGLPADAPASWSDRPTRAAATHRQRYLAASEAMPPERADKFTVAQLAVLTAPSTWGGAGRGRPGRVGGRHDTRSQAPLRRLPLSGRGHQPRRLALLPVSAEPAHGGRNAGGPRYPREP